MPKLQCNAVSWFLQRTFQVEFINKKTAEGSVGSVRRFEAFGQFIARQQCDAYTRGASFFSTGLLARTV